MSSDRSVDIACRAQAIYKDRLRSHLETTHLDEFVAIEPDSGEFFLGKSLSEAVQAARSAHPDRFSFVIRVGHRSTVEMGVLRQ